MIRKRPSCDSDLDFASQTQAGNGEKDNMENYETNSPSDKLQMKQHNQRFAEQLSEWFSTEKIPELASEDTRFTLELQKQKLKSLGLNMQLLIDNREGFSDSAAVLS